MPTTDSASDPTSLPSWKGFVANSNSRAAFRHWRFIALWSWRGCSEAPACSQPDSKKVSVASVTVGAAAKLVIKTNLI